MSTGSAIQQQDAVDDATADNRLSERGLLTLSEKAWSEAKRRGLIIAPLAEGDVVSATAARAAGAELGLSERSIYNLVKRYRRSGGLLAALARFPRPADVASPAFAARPSS